MKAEQRRSELALFLISAKNAVTGTELSNKFGVSRQIIVQDRALLKASGFEILSTHNGYVVQKSPFIERVFKLRHNREQTECELNAIIDNGGIVADVFVWHKVYGRVQADLNIHSKSDVQKFMEGVRTGKSTELMNITGG